MRTRVIVVLTAVAALFSGAALAETAQQLEQAVGGKTYLCKYDKGSALVRLNGDGSAAIGTPGAEKPEATGRWWADGGTTLCWDMGRGPACSLVDMPGGQRITRTTASGPVPCTAQ